VNGVEGRIFTGPEPRQQADAMVDSAYDGVGDIPVRPFVACEGDNPNAKA
jgi:hypothetical protein